MVQDSIRPEERNDGAPGGPSNGDERASGDDCAPGDARAPGDDFVEAMLQGVSVHAIARASGLGMLEVILAAGRAVPPERVKEIRDGANAILETRLMGLKFEALDRLKELAGRFDEQEHPEGEAETGAVDHDATVDRERTSPRTPVEITPGKARALELSRRMAVSILRLNLGRAGRRESIDRPFGDRPLGGSGPNESRQPREASPSWMRDVPARGLSEPRRSGSGRNVDRAAENVDRNVAPSQGFESCAGSQPGVSPRAEECRPVGASDENDECRPRVGASERKRAAVEMAARPVVGASDKNDECRRRVGTSEGNNAAVGGGRTFLASMGLILSPDHPP